jgi:hypothetical protein
MPENEFFVTAQLFAPIARTRRGCAGQILIRNCIYAAFRDDPVELPHYLDGAAS